MNPDGPVLGRGRPTYELAERSRAIAHGGIGAVLAVADAVGLAEQINSAVPVLASHRPYWESDHVLNIAFNALCGGLRLEDIEARRNDAVFLDALGVESLPDPTTAGDFCRRFDAETTMALQEAINRARLAAWAAGRPVVSGRDSPHRRRRVDRGHHRRDQGRDGHRLQRHLGVLGAGGLPGQQQRAAVLGPSWRQPALP